MQINALQIASLLRPQCGHWAPVSPIGSTASDNRGRNSAGMAPKAGDPSIELCVLCKAVVWRACKCGICVRVRVRGPRLVHRSTWVKNTHGGEVSWATPRRWACCSWLRREYTRYSVTLCHVTRAATCNLADAYAWSYKGGRRVDTSTRWAASMQNE